MHYNTSRAGRALSARTRSNEYFRMLSACTRAPLATKCNLNPRDVRAPHAHSSLQIQYLVPFFAIVHNYFNIIESHVSVPTLIPSSLQSYYKKISLDLSINISLTERRNRLLQSKEFSIVKWARWVSSFPGKLQEKE